MIKNDPYKILKKEKVAKKLLSTHVIKALEEYDDTIQELKEMPREKSLIEVAEQIGEVCSELLIQDIERIKDELKSEVATKQKSKVQKAHSAKVKEKSEQSLDYLAECRRKLREDRQRKIASGEIKAPVKKRLSTKLKDSLKRITSLMPKAIKEDKKKIAQTEKAMLEFLSKLKTIWGMNAIKPIEEELKMSFEKMEEKIENKT